MKHQVICSSSGYLNMCRNFPFKLYVLIMWPNGVFLHFCTTWLYGSLFTANLLSHDIVHHNTNYYNSTTIINFLGLFWNSEIIIYIEFGIPTTVCSEKSWLQTSLNLNTRDEGSENHKLVSHFLTASFCDSLHILTAPVMP